MTRDQAKNVLTHAKLIAQQAAEICKEEGSQINNQATISALMLATCIMGRFFNEDRELMHHLLEAMMGAIDEMPCADEFINNHVH
jgi:hypothetical protein